MRVVGGQGTGGMLGWIVLLAGAAVALVGSVAAGRAETAAAVLCVLVALLALRRPTFASWHVLLGLLLLVILFIPIRRYELPGSLPFQLEPYRILVALLVLGWLASLLVDPRVKLRRTGFEGPLALIAATSVASVLVNPARLQLVSADVAKRLMFFGSFVVVLYVVVSVVRSAEAVDFLVKALVAGGAVVGVFAVIEARTGYNIFDDLSHVLPFLRSTGGEDALSRGAARLRVFGSAQHPIALSAALVMITPLALYLAHRHRRRRWYLAALACVTAAAATVSRTGVVMLVVVVVVFAWLRPRETLRLWPALIPALIVIHFALPGTIGSLAEAFVPSGGIVAQQQADAGATGSGRLADLGPALQQVEQQPLLGQGFGTRVIEPRPGVERANILDDQWLGTLLETGVLGTVAWLWFFARVVGRLGGAARADDSERGRLLACLAAGVAAFAVGMLTYDAFSFVQVTFLLFVFAGLGAALTSVAPARVREGAPAARSPRARAAAGAAGSAGA